MRLVQSEVVTGHADLGNSEAGENADEAQRNEGTRVAREHGQEHGRHGCQEHDAVRASMMT